LGDNKRKKKHAVWNVCVLKMRISVTAALTLYSFLILTLCPPVPGLELMLNLVDMLEVGYHSKCGWNLGYQQYKPKSLRGVKS